MYLMHDMFLLKHDGLEKDIQSALLSIKTSNRILKKLNKLSENFAT